MTGSDEQWVAEMIDGRHFLSRLLYDLLKTPVIDFLPPWTPDSVKPCHYRYMRRALSKP